MNATGKESRRYDAEELRALIEQTSSPDFPSWVAAGLRDQLANREVVASIILKHAPMPIPMTPAEALVIADGLLSVYKLS
jgi:hypothetical protein